jgi:hypothetical protein
MPPALDLGPGRIVRCAYRNNNNPDNRNNNNGFRVASSRQVGRPGGRRWCARR